MQELRFSDDEPARHRIVDLIGDLSLAATGGSAGLPVGHVVAFNADHDLHVKFVRALVEKTGADDWVEMTLASPEVRLQQGCNSLT